MSTRSEGFDKYLERIAKMYWSLISRIYSSSFRVVFFDHVIPLLCWSLIFPFLIQQNVTFLLTSLIFRSVHSTLLILYSHFNLFISYFFFKTNYLTHQFWIEDPKLVLHYPCLHLLFNFSFLRLNACIHLSGSLLHAYAHLKRNNVIGIYLGGFRKK